MTEQDRVSTDEQRRKWRREEKRRRLVAFLFRPLVFAFDLSPGLALFLVIAFVIALDIFLVVLTGSMGGVGCGNTCPDP